jgi:DNA-binding LytR/AlgR family response regulator
MPEIKAVIADDEDQLRRYMQSTLKRLWPALHICGLARNGLEAVEMISTQEPDIAFLDIKMPGLNGIEVARQIGNNCRVVFITAYDQFAVEAFENEAIDYLLKPVTDDRLMQTIERLQKQIGSPNPSAAEAARAFERLLEALDRKDAAAFLKWVKVRHGEQVRLLAVEDICYFKSEDKYTAVKTRNGESLIRKSIRQLTAELDPDQFWQIHRGTIVNVGAIDAVHRSFGGRLVLTLKGLPEKLPVSQSYAHLFKHM